MDGGPIAHENDGVSTYLQVTSGKVVVACKFWNLMTHKDSRD